MKKNYDLFIAIRDNLSNNPDFVKNIPIEDIIKCACYELNEMRLVYDKDHYNGIQSKFIEYAEELQNAVNEHNAQKAMVAMECFIRLYYGLPDIDIVLPMIETANYDHALNRHIMNGTIVVMGDSHTSFFSGNETLSFVPIKNNMNTCIQINNYNFTVIHFGPCLAFNSDRYGSKNRLREKVEWLDENFLCLNDTIIISLGEIDIRNQVYKHVQEGIREYKDVVDEILSHYLNLLLWLKGKGYRVICYGPIGSLKDDATIGEYRPRQGSEEERNAAGRYYNERLEQLCHENDMDFFTLFYDMVDENNHTNEDFLSEDGLHLGQYGFQIAIDKLKKLGVNVNGNSY